MTQGTQNGQQPSGVSGDLNSNELSSLESGDRVVSSQVHTAIVVKAMVLCGCVLALTVQKESAGMQCGLKNEVKKLGCHGI